MRLASKKPKTISRRQKGAAWLLLSALFSVSLFYGYVGYETALNAVELRERAGRAQAAASVLSELETNYLSAKRAITLSLAYRDGFVDARFVTFITRKALGALAARNEI
ncbi:MAG: hypothetical protein Greene041679_136 [Parcubacteria group bacterium Greene0416_79]|nr:MAG: hypothetical protein Greene041679_136 [Parcubacteria group bacterium Greene0416_79]